MSITASQIKDHFASELALGEKIDARLSLTTQRIIANDLRIDLGIVRKRKALTRAYEQAHGKSKLHLDTLNAAWIEALAALRRAAQ